MYFNLISSEFSTNDLKATPFSLNGSNATAEIAQISRVSVELNASVANISLTYSRSVQELFVTNYHRLTVLFYHLMFRLPL